MNLSLLLAAIFVLTFILGKLIEKIRIPWVFSALFLGLLLSWYNPVPEITSSETFTFLAKLGMYFLLFIIGFDLNIRSVLKQGKFIGKLTFFVIFWETLLGTMILHYIFHTEWLTSILVATSFATVGEAVLVPILDEFNLIKTKFGQTLLGIGTLDDIVEIITVIAASSLLGVSMGNSGTSLLIVLLILALLFTIPLFLYLLRDKINHFKFKGVPTLFIFSLFILFLFVGVGEFIDIGFLGALLAGIALKTFLKTKYVESVELAIRTISYGFFVPIFFISIGLEVDIKYLLSAPLLILLVVAATDTTKILTSYILGRKNLGTKKSILMGIGLSAKFSTSIVIITLFHGKGFISSDLFSVLIGATIASKFIIPVLFSILIQKWHLKFKSLKRKGA